MDWGHFFTVLAAVMGVVALLGIALVLFLMWKYKIPPRGVVAMVAALVYVVSPVDVLPEAVLGPFGLIDDTGVVAGVAFFVYRLVVARRMLQAGGVDPVRRRQERVDGRR